MIRVCTQECDPGYCHQQQFLSVKLALTQYETLLEPLYHQIELYRSPSNPTDSTGRLASSSGVVHEESLHGTVWVQEEGGGLLAGSLRCLSLTSKSRA